MAAPCPLLGDGITDVTLLAIARFLPTARDLLCIGLTCPRFAAKIIVAAPSVIGGGDGAAAAPEMLRFVEKAARLWVAGCSEQERSWVPRLGFESWLGVMYEVELLRVPLAFRRAHADLTLSEGGAVATKTANYGYQSLASKVVMRLGRHFAQFSVVMGHTMMLGVLRPGWDVEGGAGAFHVDGHCFYSTANGVRWPGPREWEGRQDARQAGDRIGMLLDLDQGSMTVWKNDVKLGVMVAEGLSGPLCWAVETNIVGYRQRPHRVGAGSRVADRGEAGGRKDVASAGPLSVAGPARVGDRRRVRGSGSSRSRGR